jgi:DNA (cytosine-5)-methyltransferase 1
MRKVVAVDLFCGVGGLSFGLRDEGISVRAGVDTDEGCKFAFEKNTKAKFLSKSVEDISANELNAYYPQGSLRVLVGCAPCQPFSRYTNFKPNQKKTKAPKSDQWKLLNEFKRLILEMNPEIVSMENVPQLIDYKVYSEFESALIAAGYHVTATPIYCPDYGIPQTRTRLVLLASRLGPIELIPPTHTPENYLTVEDAIGSLPKIKAGETSKKDPFHRSRKLSNINLKRIKHSKPGGTWRDWPKELRLECHEKDSGKTYGGVYGRMDWDEPAPTMTTHCCGLGNGRFGHPEQNRAISLREAALFQTFPSTYKFEPTGKKLSQKILCRQIGNAVPVRLGSIIGKSIKKHVKEHEAVRA